MTAKIFRMVRRPDDVRVLPTVCRTGDGEVGVTRTERFETFTGSTARLQSALVARYGVDTGAEVYADAMAYAWEHWDAVTAMGNPLGYLYRVAQSSARRHLRWHRPPTFPPEACPPGREPEPRLEEALTRLRAAQRTAILLVHAYGWTYQEVAEVLDVPVSTVRNDLHRGMKALRKRLGADS